MGSELELHVRWLPLMVGLLTSASCGIFPGRDFGESIWNADGSAGTASDGSTGGADAGLSAANKGMGGSVAGRMSDSGGEAVSDGGAGGVSDNGAGGTSGSGVEGVTESAGAAGKTITSTGGAPSAVQIKSGTFSSLSGPGLALGSIRVLGQFTFFGASSTRSASGVVVRGGFQ